VPRRYHTGGGSQAVGAGSAPEKHSERVDVILGVGTDRPRTVALGRLHTQGTPVVPDGS